MLIGSSYFQIDAGSTIYLGTTASTIESVSAAPMPETFLTALRITLDAPPGENESVDVELRLDGLEAIALSIMDATTTVGWVASLNNSPIEIGDGAKLSLKVTTSANATPVRVHFAATTDDNPVIVPKIPEPKPWRKS